MNEPATVIAVVQFYNLGPEVFEKKVNIAESEKTATVELTARCPEIVLPAVPPPEEHEIEIAFPFPGRWTVRCRDLSGSIVVHEECSGEIREAEVLGFELPGIVFAGDNTPLRAKLAHESGEWFYSGMEIDRRNDSRSINIRILEGIAESVLPSDPWEENVRIPVVFPCAGRWQIYAGDYFFGVRSVQAAPCPDLIRNSRDYYTENHMRIHGVHNLDFCEPLHALEASEFVVGLKMIPESARYFGMDFHLNRQNLTAEGKVWGAMFLTVEDNEEPAREERLDLVFPVPGEWTIRFSAGPFGILSQTITVLPAEE
jgi:hypothetical protein